MSYSPRMIFLLVALHHSTTYAQIHTFINEISPHATDPKIELKVRGFLSGVLFIHSYDQYGNVIDTIDFRNASYSSGEDEYDHHVDYYVLPISDLACPQGGLALSVLPGFQVLEFVSYNLEDELVAIDGPAVSLTANKFPKTTTTETPYDHSIQRFLDNWYIGPSTFGKINHIGCPNADTTYVDTLLCAGEVFDCGLIPLNTGTCARTFVGSDDCDSTVIFSINVIENTPISLLCNEPGCQISGLYYSGSTISLQGSFLLESNYFLQLNAGIAVTLEHGFEVEESGELTIKSNRCGD